MATGAWCQKCAAGTRTVVSCHGGSCVAYHPISTRGKGICAGCRGSSWVVGPRWEAPERVLDTRTPRTSLSAGSRQLAGQRRDAAVGLVQIGHPKGNVGDSWRV